MDTESAADAPDGVRRLQAPPELKSQRLDRTLARLLPELSRTHIKELIEAGLVTANGQPQRKSGALIDGPCELQVTLAPRRNLRVERGDPASLIVLHEDEALVVIDKPPGVLAHPTLTSRGASISDLAAARYGELPTLQGRDRPGIVHRLDAGTSGVMVLARTEAAFAHLMQQFRERSIEKSYLALVYGEPRFDTGWVETGIERDPRDSSRMAVAAPGEGRDARTFYSVAERFAGLTLISAQPKSGRTHQIRVHLTSIGLALVGDKLYRRRGGHSIRLAADAPVPARQCLHASKLSFTHPLTAERVTFEAPLPADFEAMLTWARANLPRK